MLLFGPNLEMNCNKTMFQTRPEVVKFHVHGLLGGIVNTAKNKEVSNREMIEIQCFPVYSVLMALGKKKNRDWEW